MIVRPPFPAMIDNTMRAAFNECQRKFWLSYARGLVSPTPSFHLLAGQAFARGLEATRKAFFVEGLSVEDAIAIGWAALVEEYALWDDTNWKAKTCFNLSRAFVDYWREYPLETDDIQPAVFAGKPAIEFNFGIPLPILHPESGLPIIYCGRFDMLGERHAQLFVVDEKTTGSLGDYWARRYEISGQFTGYCWAAQEHGYPVVGAIVRGIGILMREIKHVQVPFPRPSYMIGEWYAALLCDIRAMIASWQNTSQDLVNQWEPAVWRPDLAHACGDFSGCAFVPVCGIDPVMREKMLEINYVVRPWDPMKLGEGEF